MGPVFICLQLLMEGGQSALWAQSKRLIDSHYWRLSQSSGLSPNSDSGVATTGLGADFACTLGCTGIQAVLNISSGRDFAAMAFGNLFEWLSIISV